MQQTKPDLTLDALEPRRKLTLDIAAITPGNLTLLEALDIAESSGVGVDDIETVMHGPQTHRQGMVVYAMAWVLARRLEPGLTFEEVCTYQLELVGQAATAQELEQEQKRALQVASVAMLAGVSTDEAEQMTLTEVAAVTSITKARRRKR